MKRQHQLGEGRNEELVVNKRTKTQLICCGWEMSVFLLFLSNHKWENPSHSSLLFVSAPQYCMFDMTALRKGEVCEQILKPAIVLSSLQQESSRTVAVRSSQQDAPGALPRSSPYIIPQKETSSAPAPLDTENQLSSSFSFTGTIAVSQGNSRNIYQNKESNYAEVTVVLFFLLLFFFSFLLGRGERGMKALHDLCTESKNKVWGLQGMGHISTHLLNAAVISYHSPECVAYIPQAQSKVWSLKRARSEL